MTIYYYDLFSGTCGTALSAHTANSGVTWSSEFGVSLVLDGNGFIYTSSQNSQMVTNAAMPSSLNFMVQFELNHLSVLSGENVGLSVLQTSVGATANQYGFQWSQGNGFGWSKGGSLLVPVTGGLTLGQSLYVRLYITTSGGTTTMAAFTSTDQVAWTALGNNYSLSTPAGYVASVAPFLYGAAQSATTGTHLGALYVQDIPTLSSVTLDGPAADSYTSQAAFVLSQNSLSSTPTTINVSSSQGAFQLSLGGGNISSVQIPAGSLSASVYFSPYEVGLCTLTFSSTGLTASNSPYTFTAISSYLTDTFGGGGGAEAGQLLTVHSSDTGATYSAGNGQNVANLTLDGNGQIYNSSSAASFAYSNATMPTTQNVQVVFSIVQHTSLHPGGGNYTNYEEIILLAPTPLSAPAGGQVYSFAHLDGWGFLFATDYVSRFGGQGSDTWLTSLPAGTTAWCKVTVQSVGGVSIFTAYYSTSSAAGPWTEFLSTFQTTPANSQVNIGYYFSGSAQSATTGVHIGDIVVSTPPVPIPTTQIGAAYVASSGGSIGLSFQTISGSVATDAVGMAIPPTVYQNGTSVGTITTCWTPGYSVALLLMPAGVILKSTDTITITTVNNWMACIGSGSCWIRVSTNECTRVDHLRPDGIGFLFQLPFVLWLRHADKDFQAGL